MFSSFAGDDTVGVAGDHELLVCWQDAHADRSAVSGDDGGVGRVEIGLEP
jgi:hypothetical protein